MKHRWRSSLAALTLSLVTSFSPRADADEPAAVEATVQSHEARGDREGAIRAGEAFLSRWPNDPRAPSVLLHVGEILAALAAQKPEASVARADAVDRACDAYLRLGAYAGTTAGDALVKKALRRCAADRTNAASGLAERGASTNDRALLQRALAAYGLAARDWTRYLLLDDRAADDAETRYWIADAWHRRVQLEAHLGGTPSPDELAAARSAARSAVAAALSAKSTDLARTYLQPASFRVVDLAQLALNLQYRRYQETNGREGIEKRDMLRTTTDGDLVRAVTDPIPRAVEEAIAARLWYVERVPRDADPTENIDLYRFQAADFHYLYGHFAEAKKQLRKLYPDRCGKSDFGKKAWSRLLDIATLEGDIPTARELANDRTCQHEPGWGCPGQPRGGLSGHYHDAYRLFERASKAPPGPEADHLWREAAEAYCRALEQAPGRDEAPEAAMNGAYAFKQIGAYGEAIAMYRLFLREYGKEETLTRLQKGDPQASPPRPADPKKYAERVRFVKQAEDALSSAYVLMLDFSAAAPEYASIAANVHFQRPARAMAARNALILYGALGDRPRAVAAHRTFRGLTTEVRERAAAGWDLAKRVLDGWDERAPDTGANRTARIAAQAEIERFVALNEDKRGAEEYVVHAAHAAAKLRRTGRDPQTAAWCRKAVRAFDRFRTDAPTSDGKSAALGSTAADLAAECALAEIDAAIRADFGEGPRRYAGGAAAIARAFAADRAKAERHARRLREIEARFGSKVGIVAARLREASLHEACAAGVDAAEVRVPGREEEWAAAARGYLEARVFAQAWKVTPPGLIEAQRRLSAIARIAGEAVIREAGRGVVDPETKHPFVFREGMFAAPLGLVIEGRVEPLPLPLPVAPD